MAVWLLSLTMPALRVNGSVWGGLSLLLWGVIGAMLGYVEWLANPLLIAAVVALWRGASRRPGAAIATALLVAAAVSVSRQGLPTDEGGMPHSIEAWLPGYFMWLGSLVLCGICLLLAQRRMPS